MNIKLLAEHNLEFLSLIGGCRGSSESTLVKMPHCWKLHVTAHLVATAQSIYNTSHYNTYLDIALSFSGSQFFFTMEFYKGINGK